MSDIEEDEAKEKYKKDMIRDKRIIEDSIKDHLIPKVPSGIHIRRCFIPYQECMKEETSTRR